MLLGPGGGAEPESGGVRLGGVAAWPTEPLGARALLVGALPAGTWQVDKSESLLTALTALV